MIYSCPFCDVHRLFKLFETTDEGAVISGSAICTRQLRRGKPPSFLVASLLGRQSSASEVLQSS